MTYIPTILYITHMPQVTVYVRDDDLPKWKSIEKKSEWLHNCMNDLPAPILAATLVEPSPDRTNLRAPAPFVPRPPDPETGYPCCLKRAPCKHWYFDGVSGAWTNELTGKTREVV